MYTLNYPPSVQWEVTSECNHNCIHCYNYWRKDEEKNVCKEKINNEEKYLKIAKSIALQKPNSVVITGGEPLLAFDRIKSSIEYLLSKSIAVSINTNATLITEEMISYLKEKGIGLFISFPCCIPEICDKITNVKGSFERIVKKLDMLHKSGNYFSCNIVVSKLNLDYVEASVDFLVSRYYATKVTITRVGKPINSSDSFNNYLLSKNDIIRLQDLIVNIHKKHAILELGTACPFTPCSLHSNEAFQIYAYTKICTAGKSSYGIDTDGNVKACPRDSTIYGNILTDDFKKIWDAMISWRNADLIPKECKKCPEFNKCLGGCRVDSFPFTSRLDMLDSISNPDNIPLKFKKEVPKEVESFTLVQKFKVKPRTTFVVDGEVVRIGYNHSYKYISKPTYEFLNSHDKFSLEDFINHFSTSKETASSVISVLLSSNALSKV